MMIFFLIICAIFGGIALFYFIYNTYAAKEAALRIEIQNCEENINLMREELHHQEILNSTYKNKLDRYNSLEGILNKLNTTLILEEIVDYLIGEIFKIIAQSEGNVIAYLLNKRTQKLEIFRSRRQSLDTAIKAKEGDIFDYWVLKQLRPLLVEDVRADFRFDLERVDNEFIRNIESLIVSPLISRDNFLGILRVDRETKKHFTTEDLRLLSTVSDIAAVAIENALLYQKTNELAIVDSLTPLYQRKYFLIRLEQELLRAKNEAKPLSLIIIDIDYFKNYNDKFGHIAGDIVLKRVASVLLSFVDPAMALSCRFGGEEFLIYVLNSTMQEAYKIAESLRQKVKAEVVILRRQKTFVTVSIGLVNFPTDATTSEDLIKIADDRLYKAKLLGRNQICLT